MAGKPPSIASFDDGLSIRKDIAQHVGFSVLSFPSRELSPGDADDVIVLRVWETTGRMIRVTLRTNLSVSVEIWNQGRRPAAYLVEIDRRLSVRGLTGKGPKILIPSLNRTEY